jgi:hypothetical protein
VLRYLNLLSLDVAAGAAIGAAFFAHVLNVSLFPQAYLALGLTVWIIYTADHLLDAYHLREPASTARHLLHQRYFKTLVWIVAVALVVDVTLVFFIRLQLMLPGAIMGVMCVAYLLFSRWLRYVKEVVGTLLYSAGVLLPALSLNRDLTLDQQLLIGEFMLIVFINMLLFARMSFDSDIRDKQQSLITTIGLRPANWLIALCFICLATVMVLPNEISWQTTVVMAAMALTLLVIFLFPAYFRSGERYRLVGDSVFLLPGLLLVVR